MSALTLVVNRETRHKILFSGFRIISLQGEPTRETVRTAILPWGIAMIQKNGNIAISNSGIFDRPYDLRAQEKVALALFRLKLVSSEFYDAAKERFEQSRHDMELVSLKHKAEQLGYTIKEKVIPKRKRRRKSIDEGMPGFHGGI